MGGRYETEIWITVLQIYKFMYSNVQQDIFMNNINLLSLSECKMYYDSIRK